MKKENRAYYNITKLGKELPFIDFDNKEHQIHNVMGEKVIKEKDGNKKLLSEISMSVTLSAVSLSEDNGIKLSTRKLTPFDMAVLDAVYTIVKDAPYKLDGMPVFTAQMVARALSNTPKSSGVYFTSTRIERIEHCLELLRHVDIKIDCTDEMTRRGIEGETCAYTGYLLPLEYVEKGYKFKDNKTHSKVYRLIKEPAIFKYMEATKQYVSVSVKFLQLQDISNTEDSILITRYLACRIMGMKRKRNGMDNPNITYEWYDSKGSVKGMLPAIGYDESGKSKVSRWDKKFTNLHNLTFSILRNFKDNGFIDGFTVNKKDGKPVGFKIEIPKTAKTKSRRHPEKQGQRDPEWF